MKTTFLFLGLLALLPWAGAGEVTTATRPNILFAFADDWGHYASAYAAHDVRPGPNTVVRTPNFDRLAAEGTLFTNAHVTSPSCTPCRSSLLSGQYFFRTGLGAILQGAIWDPSIPSYPLLLKDSGYHIGQTYKVWSPGSPRDAPYGGKTYEYESAGSKFNGFSKVVTAAVAKGVSPDAAKQRLYDEALGNFDAFLSARPGHAPFCYWFGPTNVHRSWTQGSGKKLWGLNPDDLKGKLPGFLPDVPEVREDMADYLGEVMAFDTALGHLLRHLENTGELENTLVVVSGDHGIPGFSRGKCNLYGFGTHVPLVVKWPGKGKPGRVVTDFVNLMDLAPTFLEAGGVTPPEVMTGRSIVDLLRAEKSGRLDPTRDHVVTGRERHVGIANDGLPYPQRALRTDDYLYIRNFKPDRWPAGKPGPRVQDPGFDGEALRKNTRYTFADMDAGPTKTWLVEHGDSPERARYHELAFARRPAEELYHLASDPDEITNLAGDPAHAEALKKLRTKLLTILTEAKDPRVLGDGSTFDKPPYSLLTGKDKAHAMKHAKP